MPERLLNAGWACVGTPLVEIPVTKLLLTAEADCTPPRLTADGFGRRAAGRVPDVIFVAFVVSVVAEGARPVMSAAAGWAWVGTPEVEIDVRKLCATDAIA